MGIIFLTILPFPPNQPIGLLINSPQYG